MAIGMSRSTITRRIGPDGPWQRALPGVVIGHRGIPTSFERRLAAQAYGKTGALITGLDALCEHNVATAKRLVHPKVHVIVPHNCHRTSHGFATVTRVRRPPAPVTRRGLRCAPLARALVDACRWLTELNDVRALVADVVQNHGVRPDKIAAEIGQAARQRTALSRLVIREIQAGIRSAAEAELRGAFATFGVPQPLWNHEIRTEDGDLIASPDGLWPDVWLVLELNSTAWHLAPQDFVRTQRRQRELVLLGFEVMPVSPSEVLADPEAICRQIQRKLASAVARELPGVIVQPRTGW